MDILDEKANGGPPMEVEEIVSVNDRESVLSRRYRQELSNSDDLIDEAFAAKHMPDLGHEVKDSTVYTWKLSNWKKLDKKLTSPDFECGGHRW